MCILTCCGELLDRITGPDGVLSIYVVLYSVLSGLVIWSHDLLVKGHRTGSPDRIERCMVSCEWMAFRLV